MSRSTHFRPKSPISIMSQSSIMHGASALFLLPTLFTFLSPVACKHIDWTVFQSNASHQQQHQSPLRHDALPDSFARVYQLPDGEVITKLKWNNFTAIETQFSHIDLIQIIKEFHVIQLWLSSGELVDCEFTDDPHKVQAIQKAFHKLNPNVRKDPKAVTVLEEHENLTALPQHLTKLTEYEHFVHQCSKLHDEVKRKYDESKKSRKRREIVFPGTKWCGKGSSSKNFEDLGEYSFADRCCRDHDRCKYSIGPMSTRYHLANMGYHYVSHCSCDERFRSCLKVANSGASNLVGKIYFNIMHTKCFMFQMDEVCEEETWWGTCTASKRRKRAVFRDPMNY